MSLADGMNRGRRRILRAPTGWNAAKIGNRGFALPSVLLFLGFFFVLASAVLFAAKQEQPIIDKIDNLTRARYAATGLLDIIELKMKTLDAEFHAALLDDERVRRPTDDPAVSNSPLFKEFFKDFETPASLESNVKFKVDGLTLKMVSVERQHIEFKDLSTDAGIEKYYVDVIKVTVAVTWTDAGTGNVLTDHYSKTIRFKRQEKS